MVKIVHRRGTEERRFAEEELDELAVLCAPLRPLFLYGE
jgi:hypothetical protein